jgi:hypothetical protein
MGFMKSTKRLGRLAALLSAGLAAACAASPKAEMQPGVPGSSPVQAAPTTTFAPEPEPRTLQEAEALLEKARADLDRLALNEPSPTPGSAAAPMAPSPAPPVRSESRRAESSEDGAAPAAEAESQCQTACKAYSSLSRASDAVCRLDAVGGERCGRARQIREDAARRVASCGCVK